MSARVIGSFLRVVALAVLVTARLSSAAAAQDTPVVFLHGVQASGHTWDRTASTLGQVLQVMPYKPDLLWTSSYDAQARELQSWVGSLGHQMGSLPQQTVVVAHSSGGIVAREWSKHRPLQALVTLGTPHHGADIARPGAVNWMLYQTSVFVSSLTSLVNQLPYTDFGFMLGRVRIEAGTGYQVASLVHQALWNAGAQFHQAPVYTQMATGSAYITHLNHPDTVAQERQRIGKRIGIAYAHPAAAIAGPAVAGNPDLINAYKGAVPYLSLLFAGWSNMVPPTTFSNVVVRDNLRTAALYLSNLNSMWCFVTTYAGRCAEPSDGVVATQSQFMPGGITIAGNGAAHVRQTVEGEPDIRRALVEHVGLRTRAGNSVPPGGGLPPTTLRSGERLFPGQQVSSPSGTARLLYQLDGNIVLYTSSGAIWHSGTVGVPPGFVAMQGDGNLVLYTAAGQAAWASDTNGYDNAYVSLDDTGTLRVVSQHGVTLWWSSTP